MLNLLYQHSACWWASALRWRHNGPHGNSNHQPHDCLLNCLFGRRSKKTSKLCVTGLCAWNSLGTCEFPAQMTSNAENVSISWHHHGCKEQRAISILRYHLTSIGIPIMKRRQFCDHLIFKWEYLYMEKVFLWDGTRYGVVRNVAGKYVLVHLVYLTDCGLGDFNEILDEYFSSQLQWLMAEISSMKLHSEESH